MILEAGFTIVAVNLPSLWYFTAGVSPDRVLRSIRSLASLHSGRSSYDSAKGSKNIVEPTTRDTSAGGQSLDTTSSILNKNGSEPVVESYAMTDLLHPNFQGKSDGIHIERQSHRSEEQV